MEGISATVNSMGQNSGLLSSLTDWNSTLAGYADSISTGVVMPVALTLLALFMILELYNATQRIAMNGSNNAFTIQQIALVMLKIVVCRWAVVHTTEILNALFEVASTVTVGISGYVGSGEVNTTIDIENAIADLMAKGVRMIDEKPRYGAGGSAIAFLHPKATGGVLLELCQRMK